MGFFRRVPEAPIVAGEREDAVCIDVDGRRVEVENTNGAVGSGDVSVDAEVYNGREIEGAGGE